MCMCVSVLLTQSIQHFVTSWMVAPLSMEFSRQEYWSGLSFPSPEDLPNPGIKPGTLALQADFLPSELPGKPSVCVPYSLYVYRIEAQIVPLTGGISSVQSLSRVRLCDPMNRSMPGLPVHHQLLQSTQTLVHRVGNAIQPSHPLSSPSPPAPNPSQHQNLFQ